MTPPPVDMSFSVTHRRGAVLIEIGGEVDLVSSPVLERMLTAAIDGDQPLVVLDLGGVRFMGLEGLRLVLQATDAVEATGRLVELRAASLPVRRLLEGAGRAVPESLAVTDRLADDLVREAEAAAASDIVSAALLAIARAAATPPGDRTSSVTVLRASGPTTMAATDPTSRYLDEVQYDAGSGPCLLAATTGAPVRIEAIAEETRWPGFVQAAAAEGVVSVLSTPIGAEHQPAGALNLYSLTRHPEDGRAATDLAAAASDILRLVTPPAMATDGPDRIRAALESRRTISLAQGAEMVLRGVGESEAYSLLGQRARDERIDLRAAADKVLRGIAGEPDRGATDGPPGG